MQASSDEYRKVSSMTRSALLLGRFTSGLLSQLLSSLDVLDYRQLNFVSLGSVSLAFFFSLLLPPVKTSIYFYRQRSTGTTGSQVDGEAAEAEGQAIQGCHNKAITYNRKLDSQLYL